MKKIKIKGNDYVMVHERVKEFHNLHPNGSIKTEIVELSDDRFITVTTVTPDVKIPERCFTGVACEKITDDSSLENCETSSCGRALGFLNIGIDTSIASYEEVSKAIEKQQYKPAKPAGKTGIEKINEVFDGSEAQISNPVTFGKHNGKEWSDVPKDYLEWLCTKGSVDWQVTEGKKELDRRNNNGVPNRPNKASGGMSEVAYEETVEMPS